MVDFKDEGNNVCLHFTVIYIEDFKQKRKIIQSKSECTSKYANNALKNGTNSSQKLQV